MRVTIDGNFDDDSREIERMVMSLQSVFAAKPEQKWQLRMQAVRYMGPWATSIIAMAVLRGRVLRQAPRVLLPETSRELKRYCDSCGLTDLVGRAKTTDGNDLDTLALRPFREMNWLIPEDVLGLLQRHVTLSVDLEESLRVAVGEILQNVEDHAESKVGGLMVGRFLSGSTNEVRLAIIDAGVGIQSAIERKFEDRTDPFRNMSDILRGKLSSLSRANNKGLGISLLFDAIKALGGRACLWSHSIRVDAFPSLSSPRVLVNTPHLPGTFVGMAVPVI